MDRYFDLKMVCYEDESAHNLLGKIYTALHLELVERASSNIGVSFPGYTQTGMGDVLRLHGSNESLREILESHRFRCLADYYSSEGSNPYPADHTWKLIKRVQPKMTAARARRMVRRGSASEERAQALYDQGPAKLKTPYLYMSSGSTGQRYRLYVSHVECQPPVNTQSFNTFGLGACVPWF